MYLDNAEHLFIDRRLQISKQLRIFVRYLPVGSIFNRLDDVLTEFLIISVLLVIMGKERFEHFVAQQVWLTC